MGRPIRKYPLPKICRRGNAFRIRWYAFEKWFEFSLGAVTKEEAQRICLMLGAAFANKDQYPEETIHQPAVKRYIALTNGLTADFSDDEFITRYHCTRLFSCRRSCGGS